MLMVQPKKGSDLRETAAEHLLPGSVVNRIRGTGCIGGSKLAQAGCRRAFLEVHCAPRCVAAGPRLGGCLS